MTKVFEALSFPCGKTMTNRLMLAPLTNTQSEVDGRLSGEEIHWLSMRAKGGFGLTMTAAAHVNPLGQGFAGQLGIFSDKHLPGLSKLADKIKSQGSLAVVQLHHAGFRAPREVTGDIPVAPSPSEKFGARGLSHGEVQSLIEDFIRGAERAKQAGFDGVEIHGAHSYIICQFLSAEFNRRTDEYGGSLKNRSKVLFDIISGIRKRCGVGFLLGVRLSPERHGILLEEAVDTAKALFAAQEIDFLDISAWDVFKEPVAPALQGRSLLSYFTTLDRGDVRLGAAGKVYMPEDIQYCFEQGLDFSLLGRAGILHHNYPQLLRDNANFVPNRTPVSREYLLAEGLSEKFLDYINGMWPDFIKEPEL
ncbi:MAG: NADH:flavin oxidoreductase [Zhongshania sp.]|uniref:NADH:flavin oxidoreductase n=1 Tax=Zhongshania sp. TaxID=1971902 RepID=UPI0026151FBA|nr:NADH:flavin oxidoreductase [Zhongshania sp.]MDF1692363.1 NADH:flavin oxidoreductase [Zhongshania sp.]